jgi:mannose-1-phosphate guanylyltransferase
MKAVVLVGGGGTRLRPLTYAILKPLVPVLNEPLVGVLMRHLARHGVDEVVLAASANDKSIEATIGDGAAFGVKARYSYETEMMGSGLAVKEAARDFKEPFFVCNGDVLNNADLTAMQKQHKERGAIMSIFLAPVSDTSAFGTAAIEPDNRITKFVEKPAPGTEPSNLVNCGTWLFEPEVLDHIPDQKMDGSIERLVMPGLIEAGRLLLGFPDDAYWLDVGTPERYLQIHSDILTGKLPGWLHGDAKNGTLVGPRTNVGEGAIIVGPASIGSNCEIGSNATIERSVIWDDVSIGAGAVVVDSIIGAGCKVGPSAVLEGAILANGAIVGAGVKLGPGSKLMPKEAA